MKVKLITDSASDITPEDEKKYGIDIMPFDITLGDESLRERVDFTAPEFLEMIDKSEYLPKTSQITEIRFAEKFEASTSARSRFWSRSMKRAFSRRTPTIWTSASRRASISSRSWRTPSGWLSGAASASSSSILT